MKTDFYDAHDRHWHDAEKLHADRRWANADHLYGLAVECGLKRLMLAFGMRFDSSRLADPKDRKHADQLWARYEAYREGHANGGGYAIPARNPFSDWSVEQRYANQNEFDATRVDAHRVGAGEIRRLVSRARDDGLIT